MEKLIKLLNESTNGRFKSEQDLRLCIEMRGYCRNFIKRLVDNNKIDFELDSIIHKHKGIDYYTGKGIVVEKLCDRYESLLMLLTIQEKPINFLVSILK